MGLMRNKCHLIANAPNLSFTSFSICPLKHCTRCEYNYMYCESWGILHDYLNTDHFVNAPSQWKKTLHWLGAHTKWSLFYMTNILISVIRPSPMYGRNVKINNQFHHIVKTPPFIFYLRLTVCGVLMLDDIMDPCHLFRLYSLVPLDCEIQWNPSAKARNVLLKLQNWPISVHHSLQIMFILPLMTGHLFWKATILGGLYRGVPLYTAYQGVYVK